MLALIVHKQLYQIPSHFRKKLKLMKIILTRSYKSTLKVGNQMHVPDRS